MIAKQKLQASMQPPPPSELEQMQLKEIQFKLEAQKISLQIEKTRSDTERMRVMVEAQKADSSEAKDITAAMLNIAKAEAEEAGTQMNIYQAKVDAVLAKSTGAQNGSGTTETNGEPSQPLST